MMRAMGRGKFFGLWLLLVGATLYIPFQEYLQTSNYADADEFFQDVLVWVVTGGLLLVPFALMVGARRRERETDAKAEASRK